MPRERSDMRRVKELLRLAHELGYSKRQIAQSIRMPKTTVGDYLARAAAAGLRYADVAELSEEAAEALLELATGGKPRVTRALEAIGDALAVLKLLAPVCAERLASARALAGGADAAMLPLVQRALAQESDAEIRALLEIIAAGMQLKSESRDARLAAIRTLGRSSSPSSKTLLLELANERLHQPADERVLVHDQILWPASSPFRRIPSVFMSCAAFSTCRVEARL